MDKTCTDGFSDNKPTVSTILQLMPNELAVFLFDSSDKNCHRSQTYTYKGHLPNGKCPLYFKRLQPLKIQNYFFSAKNSFTWSFGITPSLNI